MIKSKHKNTPLLKTKHCIFENKDVLTLFVNDVVLTLEKIKKWENSELEAMELEIAQYNSLVEEYLNNKNTTDQNLLSKLSIVFNKEKSKIFKGKEYISTLSLYTFNLDKINLNVFNYQLKLQLHKNQYFKETYLFKYVDYINSLNHSDIEDLIFPHEKFKELTQLKNINFNCEQLNLSLILITINLLFNSDGYFERIIVSNGTGGNGNYSTIKKINIKKFSSHLNSLLLNNLFSISIIQDSYKEMFKNEININKFNNSDGVLIESKYD